MTAPHQSSVSGHRRWAGVLGTECVNGSAVLVLCLTVSESASEAIRQLQPEVAQHLSSHVLIGVRGTTAACAG